MSDRDDDHDRDVDYILEVREAECKKLRQRVYDLEQELKELKKKP